MILKALLVLGVIAAVYFLFIKKPAVSDGNKKRNKNEQPKANDMVECNSCGVYVEVNEAILSNGKYYCSKTCIEKG